MQVRVITMRYNEGLQGFLEEQLHKATFGKSVLSVSEHFFVHGNVPHLALVLQLGDAPQYENAGSYRPRDPNAPDPMEGMTDSQRLVFLALKTWRNETAKEEGRPACALARRYAGRAAFFCKMDVRRYFDSIGHDRLLGVPLPTFREREVKRLVERIVRHPVPGQSDYVAGTDPTDAASRLTASIAIEDGKLVVSWSPALNGDGVRDGVRTYRVWGKANLTALASF